MHNLSFDQGTCTSLTLMHSCGPATPNYGNTAFDYWTCSWSNNSCHATVNSHFYHVMGCH